MGAGSQHKGDQKRGFKAIHLVNLHCKGQNTGRCEMSAWNLNQAFPPEVSAVDQPDRICYSNRAVYVSSCLYKRTMWSTIAYCCTHKPVYASFLYMYFLVWFTTMTWQHLLVYLITLVQTEQTSMQIAHACITLVSHNGLTVQLIMLILSWVKVRWDVVKTVQYTYTDVLVQSSWLHTLCCNEAFNRVCMNMSAPDVC